MFESRGRFDKVSNKGGVWSVRVLTPIVLLPSSDLGGLLPI